MARTGKQTRKLFVLDTNVLMHDPTALFRFAEHDIFIPLVVLEELDAAKKGLSEVSRNVRQVSRFMDDLIQRHPKAPLHQGIPLGENLFSDANAPTEASASPTGHLYFQTETMDIHLPDGLPSSRSDNTILGVAMGLRASHPHHKVILVSKDINMRIKARAMGLPAEDYFNDRVVMDIEQLHSGLAELPEDFWDTHSKSMESWKEEGRTYYKIEGPLVEHWTPNHCLYTSSPEPFQAIVREVNHHTAIMEIARDYSLPKNQVWGIQARNLEQSFALNLLMDPDIDFVSLQGPAGTGKTLLTLAAALEQTIEQQLYKEIVMTRVTVPVGEDIGFLPGTEEEKMTPWMGALMDNLEVLAPTNDTDQWGQVATHDVLRRWIKIRSLNFMRGRTFLNKFVIIDEAQNLTPKQMKTLITRAGPGTKVVCMGNVAQIDTPYLTEFSSGITYVVDRFRNWPHAGHITLRQGERSRLADFASHML
jgi:PhoH-like ATPase